MTGPRPFRLALVVALTALLGLTACGRKGPLDPPPGAAVAPPPGAPVATRVPVEHDVGLGLGPDGKRLRPVPAPKRSEPFFLDWLIN